MPSRPGAVPTADIRYPENGCWISGDCGGGRRRGAAPGGAWVIRRERPLRFDGDVYNSTLALRVALQPIVLDMVEKHRRTDLRAVPIE